MDPSNYVVSAEAVEEAKARIGEFGIEAVLDRFKSILKFSTSSTPVAAIFHRFENLFSNSCGMSSRPKIRLDFSFWFAPNTLGILDNRYAGTWT